MAANLNTAYIYTFIYENIKYPPSIGVSPALVCMDTPSGNRPCLVVIPPRPKDSDSWFSGRPENLHFRLTSCLTVQCRVDRGSSNHDLDTTHVADLTREPKPHCVLRTSTIKLTDMGLQQI